MDGQLVQLKQPVITIRMCPACGYLIPQRCAKMALFNYKCPRCGAKKLSEFFGICDSEVL